MSGKLLLCLTIPLTVFIAHFSKAQGSSTTGQDVQTAISTAVPFMMITPDARAAGMGDAGAATLPDANAIYWNPAKLIFNTTDIGASLSVTPWLKNLGLSDVYLFNGSGYYKLRKQDAIGITMHYFSLGNITFTNDQGYTTTENNPNEFAIGGTYSRQLSEHFSVGTSAKFIHSNLTGGATIQQGGSVNQDFKPANNVAVDLSAYYNREIAIAGNASNLAFGAVLSNFGPKLSYSSGDDRRDFLPINLRLGTALTTELDLYNKITFTVDANKLMVPSSAKDRTDKSLLDGMFSSFADAKGGFSEEMREIIYNVGAEYWYDNIFAVRGGYFHEAKTKGNRKYFTTGLGLRYQMFGFDFSYLIPTEQGSTNPLANTLRLTLSFNLDKASTKQESVTE